MWETREMQILAKVMLLESKNKIRGNHAFFKGNNIISNLQ